MKNEGFLFDTYVMLTCDMHDHAGPGRAAGQRGKQYTGMMGTLHMGGAAGIPGCISDGGAALGACTPPFLKKSCSTKTLFSSSQFE